jgi:transcriptional regulator with XRE-family HTH domain
MDDQRFGALLRHLRVKRRLRQIDVARLAGVSDSTISRIERGHLTVFSLAVIRQLCRVLEARAELVLWTRSGEVERIADRRHAELVERLIAVLHGLGWVARPEVSFNIRAERGLVDILAWHAATATLLLIEVKTEIVDVGELFGTFDRKRRLGLEIGRLAGFEARAIAAALVVADTHTNHRRIVAHSASFGAALPDGGQRFRAFLRRPSGSLAAVAFWPNLHPGTVRRRSGGTRRVRRPAPGPGSSIPRSGERR